MLFVLIMVKSFTQCQMGNYESPFFFFFFQHANIIKFKHEQMSHAHACTKIKFKINNVDMGGLIITHCQKYRKKILHSYQMVIGYLTIDR